MMTNFLIFRAAIDLLDRSHVYQFFNIIRLYVNGCLAIAAKEVELQTVTIPINTDNFI